MSPKQLLYSEDALGHDRHMEKNVDNVLINYKIGS